MHYTFHLSHVGFLQEGPISELERAEEEKESAEDDEYVQNVTLAQLDDMHVHLMRFVDVGDKRVGD